jgi:hypothetical protein
MVDIASSSTLYSSNDYFEWYEAKITARKGSQK